MKLINQVSCKLRSAPAVVRDIFGETHRSMSHIAKRVRIQSPAGWTCAVCRRASFATTARPAQQQDPKPQDDRTTHFGFETVAEDLKASKVAGVFSSVASSYDRMNDFMSLGIHRLWKDHFVRSLNPGTRRIQGDQVRCLDIAGGSGDIALRILDHATKINGDKTLHVTVSDINPDMLVEGRKRLSSTEYAIQNRIDYMEANAEELVKVPDNSIDLYTVSFGIRNFTHKDKALREAFRVLKPGGVFACLEFAPNLSNPLFNAVYKRWSFGAIPLIGQIVAADRDSYQYLVESIERFPKQEDFARMIRDAGFILPGRMPGDDGVSGAWEDLSLGIAAIHKGIKPV